MLSAAVYLYNIERYASGVVAAMHGTTAAVLRSIFVTATWYEQYFFCIYAYVCVLFGRDILNTTWTIPTYTSFEF